MSKGRNSKNNHYFNNRLRGQKVQLSKMKVTPRPTPNNSLLDLLNFVEDNPFPREHVPILCDLLGIPSPPIENVCFIFEFGQDFVYNGETIPAGHIGKLYGFHPEVIPDIANAFGGYCDPQNNLVTIPSFSFYYDEFSQLRITPLSTADQLFLLAHELRHFYQLVNHPECFVNNGTGYNVLYDESEIDADGFALAYAFSKNTSLNPNDFQVQLKEVCYQNSLSNGARFNRAINLAREYNLDITRLKEVEIIVNNPNQEFNQKGVVLSNGRKNGHK